MVKDPPMSSAFWSVARGRMLLDPSVINLNTGSFGPSPHVVFERVTALRQRLAEEPMDFLLRSAPPLLDERDEFGSTPRLRFFEFEGTRDSCAWLTIPTAIDFQAELGWQRIRTRISELTRHVRRRLIGLAGLTPNTPDAPELSGAMVAFRLQSGVEASTLRRRLWEEFRIELPIIERPDRLLLRTSTHFYNTEAEVDRLAEALPKLLTRNR